MPLLSRFDTPASLRDVPPGSAFYDNWHDFVSAGIPESTPGGSGVGELYNASLVDVNAVGQRTLVWMAFPRRVLMPLRDDRVAAFTAAEDRDVQDEYCEWRVTRNASGRITRVVFVTEPPEYWEALWAFDRGRVVELYRDLLGEPSVQEADLHDGSGSYRRRNRWNEREGATDNDGIVHLTQRINTLSAALGLTLDSTELNNFRDNYEDEDAPGYNTSVDPRVDLDVGTLVRKGLSVTLRDPVGLYIVGWDDTGWTQPNGKPVGNYWQIVRGRPGQVLRLQYEVPGKAGFVVGDIRIGGRLIEWGGQIAEHVSVSVVGTAGTRAGESGASASGAALVERVIDEEAAHARYVPTTRKRNGVRRFLGRERC